MVHICLNRSFSLRVYLVLSHWMWIHLDTPGHMLNLEGADRIVPHTRVVKTTCGVSVLLLDQHAHGASSLFSREDDLAEVLELLGVLKRKLSMYVRV